MTQTAGYRTSRWEPKWDTLIALVNLHDSPAALEKFNREHPDYNHPRGVSLQERDDLRKLWRKDNPDIIATHLLFDQPYMTFMLNARLHMTEGIPMMYKSPAVADWYGHGLTYQPQNQFQSDLYELLKNSRLALTCGRIGQDCPTPYFVGPNSRYVYCSEGCEEWGIKTAKDKYAFSARKKPKSKPRKGK